MKAYDVTERDVRDGIEVILEPYPHIVLGQGGHKRATWVALGKRDVDTIVKNVPVTERRLDMKDMLYKNIQTGTISKIIDVAVIELKDPEGNPNGRYLIVAPRHDKDDRVLVLWRVESGYRGSASISPGEGVIVVAVDSAWKSGRGNLGETAEMLAILKPGQELCAKRTGRRIQNTSGRLVYAFNKISVTFGGDELVDVIEDAVDGEYL